MQTDDQNADQAGPAVATRISKLAEISREMVRIYKDQFGRGPTRARSDFAGPDLVIVTLEDTLTPAEKRMAQLGDHQRLRDLRLYLQHATEEQFCGVIERILERRVRAFISGMDTGQDVAAELFYLEARGTEAKAWSAPGGDAKIATDAPGRGAGASP